MAKTDNCPMFSVVLSMFSSFNFVSVFEPDNDENEDEYKKIHEEYKNLVNNDRDREYQLSSVLITSNPFRSLLDQVDFMLGSYMEDIGITSGQFEAACGVASEKIKTQFHHALFEQVSCLTQCRN